MDANRLGSLKALYGLVRPYRYLMFRILACLVVLACLNLAMPKVLKYVIDDIFDPEQPLAAEVATHRLILVLGVVLLIYAARNALYYFSKTRVMVVGERSAFELRRQLIGHLHTLSVDFYQQNNPGKISARVMQDVQSVKQFIQEELVGALLNTLMLIVAAVLMLHTNWLLALVTLAVMPFHVLSYSFFRKPIATYAREARRRIADVSGDLIEQFDGATTVKASATQLLEQEKLSRSMRRSMQAQIQESRYYILQKVAAELLVGVGVIVLLSVGGYLVINRRLTTGEFIAFNAYIGLLYPRLLDLVAQAGKFTRTAASVERVSEILQIEPTVRENADAVPHEITAGRIEFRKVSFAYRNGPILQDVSFVIEPNEHVLVTGPSGSGKSTCVNLIPRFYDPTAGQILIDGVDVRDFTLNALRRQIGCVFQDVFLFNDTIMANIRYAWPTATDEEVIEAARKAYAHEFIERLPDGYMTLVGEGGIELSQGEKRRLMIARAILKNPRILILDEPLVSLDPQARKGALEGLTSLIKDRTVITISHYPAELPFADKQVHISDGHATVRDLTGQALL